MCDTTFTFGQRGGFYFESPSQWRFGALPTALRALFADKTIAATYCVTMGANNSWFAAYKDKDGDDNIMAEGLPTSLMQWLCEKNSSGYAQRSIKDLYVVLGPYNKSYYATDGTRQQWLNLPKGLDEAIEQRRKPGGGWTHAPKIVTVGVGGNYLFTTASGGYSYQLSNYKSLEACCELLIEQSGNLNALHKVVLNAYRLQSFVLQSENGIVVSSHMPPHAEEAMTSMEVAIKTDTATKVKRDAAAAQVQQIQQLNQLARARQELELAAMQRQVNQMRQLNAAMMGMALRASMADLILASQGMGL